MDDMNEEYTVIKFTTQELEVIAQALSEIPYRIAEPLIGKIRTEYKEQRKSEMPEGAQVQ